MIDELRLPEAYRNPPGTNPDAPSQINLTGNVYGQGNIPPRSGLAAIRAGRSIRRCCAPRRRAAGSTCSNCATHCPAHGGKRPGRGGVPAGVSGNDRRHGSGSTHAREREMMPLRYVFDQPEIVATASPC